MIKKLFQFIQRKPSNELTSLPRDQHSISRRDISPNAIKVLYRLKNAGYESYLVGGCVRDLMLGLHPKDFDVTTNATPEEVKQLFSNSRLIGRRFKLVHVTFGREVIEVATFRASHDPEEKQHHKHHSASNDHGMLLRDNVYGTLEDDAERRDFTVNAMYYSIADFGVKAYAQSLKDVQNKQIRIIGDPEKRYREDPVRMLRAARFAAKLDFTIEPGTANPIPELGQLLTNVPAARLFDEVLKLLMSGKALQTLKTLQQLELFEPLFPISNMSIQGEDGERAQKLIEAALSSTDSRINQGKPVTPAFLFCALLWPSVQAKAQSLVQDGTPLIPAYHQAAHQVTAQQCLSTSIPKRFSLPMKEIWDLQQRLPRRTGRRAEVLVGHPRFRAAYDFLLLREKSGENLDGLGQWWTDYQSANGTARTKLASDAKSERPRKRRRRRPPAKSKPQDQ